MNMKALKCITLSDSEHHMYIIVHTVHPYGKVSHTSAYQDNVTKSISIILFLDLS